MGIRIKHIFEIGIIKDPYTPVSTAEVQTLVPGTMNEKCLVYEQNMNMNQRHDSKTCWCQASTCGGSPHSEMVQILLKGYI